ncbi:MAG: D-alanyl-D-alanine carboxypeptidase family protein [Acidimicrobiales bacterium]
MRTRIRTLAHALFVVFAAGSIIVGGVGAQAQDDVTELEDLKSEREALIEGSVEAVENIDAATASVDELADALDLLSGHVVFQRSRLEDAQRTLESAQVAVDAARAQRDSIDLEIGILAEHLNELAIASYTGESLLTSDSMVELALTADPGESARFRELVELQTGTVADGLDRMANLEYEAAQLVDAEAAALAEAERSLAVVEERSQAFVDAVEAQQTLLTAAETRLEARLAEAAFLEIRDVELAEQIRDQQESINRRLMVSALQNGVEIPDPVDLLEIVTLRFPDEAPDFTIEVHESIAEAAEGLFLESFADGIDLRGWGYRPIQLQIELRKAHCGGTDFDIWHKPVFECAPPTARPGFSKHEQGLAIDFTHAGAPITSIDSRAFLWLSENAPAWGFKNLEGEPWHWSLTGE